MIEQQIPIEILLVEDNPTDILLTEEAFGKGKILNHLSTVQDGMEAIAFLHRRGAFSNAPRPNIILLDLNLPIKDGYEVLTEIKSDESFQSIPVIILSTSSQEIDIARAYSLHANCYIVKPVNFGRFREIVKTIETFWFATASLPVT